MTEQNILKTVEENAPIDVEDDNLWKVAYQHESIYTGGAVDFLTLPSSQIFLLGLCSDAITFVDFKSGRLATKLYSDEALKQAVEINEDFDISHEKFCAFAVHSASLTLLTCSDNQLMKVYRINVAEEEEMEEESAVLVQPPISFTQVKVFKAHTSPVTCLRFHASGKFVVTGSSDSTMKVFDVQGGFCTHNFRTSLKKGSSSFFTTFKSIILDVAFHKDAEVFQVFGSDNLGVIRRYTLVQPKLQSSTVLKNGLLAELNGHQSAVNSLAVAKEQLISVGRDKVIIIWSLKTNDALRTLSIDEPLESVVLLPTSKKAKDLLTFITAGESGMLQCFSFNTERKEFDTKKTVPTSPQQQILQLKLFDEGKQLVAANYENTLSFFKVAATKKELLPSKQLLGSQDEILDLACLDERRIIVANNSSSVQVLQVDKFSSSFLIGHRETVLSVCGASTGDLILTGSKDNTMRVWASAAFLKEEKEAQKDSSFTCVAVCEGHTDSVSSVGFIADIDVGDLRRRVSKKKPIWLPFCVSCGFDKTIKLWYLRMTDFSTIELEAVDTKVGHSKVINALAVSPRRANVAVSPFFVSCSMDKTVKVWEINSQENAFSLRSVLSGHRRGIWSVAFSPVEKLLVSASSDKLLKLWNLSTLKQTVSETVAPVRCDCLASLAGHENSVLKAIFLETGKTIVSSDSDGVIKFWSVPKRECYSTLNHHSDRIWTLLRFSFSTSTATERNEIVISGGTDSMMSLIADYSKEVAEKKAELAEEKIKDEEALIACERNQDLFAAAKMAFKLNKPEKLKALLSKMLSQDQLPEVASKSSLMRFIETVQPEEVGDFWGVVAEWNRTSKGCAIAQQITRCLLHLEKQALRKSPGELDGLEKRFKPQAIDAFVAYSERHLRRVEKTRQDSYLIDHALALMGDTLS